GRMLRNVLKLTDVPFLEVVNMATSVPAKIVHVDDRKGKLVPGMDADITMFDDEIAFAMTMVGGEVVFSKNL
ncbi:MAG: amidohydrolase family protein, partial [Chloroflexi bacterium]|nr:amidohydrolase family protein [Chloroflexota bacterium]